MTDVFDGPFGTYSVATGVINGTAKNQLGASLVSFASLLGITLTAGDGVSSTFSLKQNPTTSVVAAKPGFDAFRPEQLVKIGEELKALANAMDAAAET